MTSHGRRRLAFDAGLATLACAMSLMMLDGGGFGPPGPGSRALDPLGIALVVASSAPLVAVRWAPLTGYAGAAAGSLALLALGYPLDVPFTAAAGAYALAVTAGDRQRVVACLAVGGFVPAVAVGYAVRGSNLRELAPELLTLALAMAGTWIAGDRTRLRRERIVSLQEQAVRAEREVERERRLAAAEERALIARELHDSAGHAINVILVQAGAARLLHERDPERARQSIMTVEAVARDLIGEIDQLVRALRDPGTPASTNPATTVSTVSTVSTTDGEVRPPLHGNVANAVYRILQEALTNAARHGAGDADVTVSCEGGTVSIAVTNPTTPAGPGRTAGGHGLVGMRERVALLGGSLEAGALEAGALEAGALEAGALEAGAGGAGGGTFRLRATLPLGGTAR